MHIIKNFLLEQNMLEIAIFDLLNKDYIINILAYGPSPKECP